MRIKSRISTVVSIWLIKQIIEIGLVNHLFGRLVIFGVGKAIEQPSQRFDIHSTEPKIFVNINLLNKKEYLK